MATQIKLEFDNPADALVFLRLAELAKGVRVVEEDAAPTTSHPPSHPTPPPGGPTANSQLPPPTSHPQNPDSEDMRELDDMLPDWFK